MWQQQILNLNSETKIYSAKFNIMFKILQSYQKMLVNYQRAC